MSAGTVAPTRLDALGQRAKLTSTSRGKPRAVATALTWFFIAAILSLAVWVIPIPFFGASVVGSAILLLCGTKNESASREFGSVAAALPMSVLLIAGVHVWIIHLTPQIIDPALVRVDFGIGRAFYRLALAHAGVRLVATAIYCALPIAFACLIATYPRQARIQTYRCMCLAAICAVPFYLTFPAVGLAHVANPAAAPRNCMPSLHLSWAFILYLSSRRTAARRWMLAFVCLTAFATLATGEHYVIDLIAAIPFTLVVYAVTFGPASPSVDAVVHAVSGLRTRLPNSVVGARDQVERWKRVAR